MINLKEGEIFEMGNFMVKKVCEQASEQRMKKLFEILENSANYVGKGTLKDKIEIWKRKRGGEYHE